jgi:thiol:disulfide interchange protein
LDGLLAQASEDAKISGHHAVPFSLVDGGPMQGRLQQSLCLALALAASPVFALGGGARFEVEPARASAGAEVVLRVTLELASGEHVYAPTSPAGLPTALELTSDGLFEKRGALTSGPPKRKFDANFDSEVEVLEGKVVFEQRLKVLGDPGPRRVAGSLGYLVCDAESCRPGEEAFDLSFEVVASAESAAVATAGAVDPARDEGMKYSLEVTPSTSQVEAGERLELRLDLVTREDAYAYAVTTPEPSMRPSVTLAAAPFEAFGSLEGPKAKAKEDEFMGPVEIHMGEVRWTQAVKAPQALGRAELAGRVMLQVCDAEACVSVELDFRFAIEVIEAKPRVADAALQSAPLLEALERIEQRVGALADDSRAIRQEVARNARRLEKLGKESNKGSRFDEVLEYGHDYDAAMAKVQGSEKKLFVVFTGVFCTNCRAMESSVLIDPKVVEKLEGFERVVLHTDTRDAHAKRAQELLRGLGDGTSIPRYYVIDSAGETLASHTGVATVEEFSTFLSEGGSTSEAGWLGFLLSCVGFGLLTLIMPCTYPMIPITISVFSKGDQVSRSESLLRASAYALGIILSYTAVGGVVQILFKGAGQQRIQDFANNGIVNLGIGAIFVYFAFSFFGYYEIAMPSFLQRFMQRGQGKTDAKGGVPMWSLFLMGAFFMLTSYSCGAPFVLAVFEKAASKPHPLSVVLALFVFSSTLALPFLLLALVPGMLQSMPRSGGWFTTFKVTLGFLELAFALKFLSTFDINYQLMFLTRPVFLGLCIVILGLTGLYQLGFFRLPHDPPAGGPVSMGRLVCALLMFCCAVYLASWFAGQPLEANLEALLPPHPYPILVSPGG